MKINRYFPFAFLYFFLNSVALPIGLTYTTLLAPLFYVNVLLSKKKEILLPFLICLLPFIVAHSITAVHPESYLASLANYAGVYIFCHVFFLFLQQSRDPERLFYRLLCINLFFCFVALIAFFTRFQSFMWMQNALNGGGEYTRLKMFTYEPSHYALLFVPLFLYFSSQLILSLNKVSALSLIAMLIVPLLLSFSIGVVAALLTAALLAFIVYFRKLAKRPRVFMLVTISGSCFLGLTLILMIVWPDNIIFTRIHNIISGNDSSGNGRTAEAFTLAQQLLQLKNPAWGIGPGQIKMLGGDLIRDYYMYPPDYGNIAIPNAAAETLAIFGWIGLFIRLTAEVVLFICTRVWTNYYRLLLFLFIFIYQFTGSFITNVAEYVIWILAFTNVFPAFDVDAQRKQHPKYLALPAC